MARKQKSGVPAQGSPKPGAATTGRQSRVGPDEQPSEQPASAGASARNASFPIVGVGASAGGLAAFEAFLSAMPTDVDTGMAFVLVQHLAPDHKSILSELVKRYTRMQVFEVVDGMSVQPDCTYIIPPNRDMALLNGTLQLFEPMSARGLRMSIDYFFRSLAQDQRERAIGIILSGTGSDGTLGVRAIKGEGGMVMVQAPESTEYDGMPQSAIATGMVDFVLPPEEMAAQLFAYVDHVYGAGKRTPVVKQRPKVEATLTKICVVLRAQTGHDFSQYKQNTVVRRVERRMALQQIEQPDAYLRFLQQNSAEVAALFNDLLIGVTSFFRDPDAFTALQEEVLPRLFAETPPDVTVRFWVCGCSTGEEAYSIAIVVQEYLEKSRQFNKVQIFATDIDARAINVARAGLYPASIAADITPERLARHFSLEPGNAFYRIKKSLRDMLVFSEQDVIKDPPFSRVDLISCRNLLIYMNAELQRKVIALFHYALNPKGVLFLGTSETVTEQTVLFTVLDRKWKIYLRRQDGVRLPAPASVMAVFPRTARSAPGGPERADTRSKSSDDVRALTEQSLLAHYAQAAVLINRNGDVRYIFGRTGKYLEPAPGDATVNILSMARDGLRRELATALHKAATRGEIVRQPGLRVRTNGNYITANLIVQPVTGFEGTSAGDFFLVILEEVATVAADETAAVDGDDGLQAPSADSLRIASLEQELRAKEEYLQTTLEEMETSNEELRSTNEEMQSVNEELQSTNEELETSKEELQSVNEELATVNAELQVKVADLSRANNDMNNLLAGTGIGTLFVDNQLRIARFTPAVTDVLNLIPSDVGRPVGHIVPNFADYSRLLDDVQAVLDTLTPREAEVETTSGAWYLMRIRPYRTLDNVIEGAVISFVNITERKQAQSLISAQLAEISAYYDSAPIGLAVLDTDLRYVRLNERLAEFDALAADRHIGRTIEEVSPRLAPKVRATVTAIMESGKPVEAFRLYSQTETESGVSRTWQLGLHPIKDDRGRVVGFSIIVYEPAGRPA